MESFSITNSSAGKLWLRRRARFHRYTAEYKHSPACGWSCAMSCEKCEYKVDVYQQGLLNVTYFRQFAFISVKLRAFCSLRQAVNCPSTPSPQIHILSILLYRVGRRRKLLIFYYQHLWSLSKLIWTAAGWSLLWDLVKNEWGGAVGLWEKAD